MADLRSVNWNVIGQTASTVGTAAGFISDLANNLKKAKSGNTGVSGGLNVTRQVNNAPASSDGGVIGVLLPIAVGFFLFGR